MQVSRKKTRRLLLQKLYSQIYSPVSHQDFITSYYDNILDFDIDTPYFEEMFLLIIQKQDTILSIIKTYAPKFDIETMEKISILAIAIAITEMLWLKESIPAKVSINEAIELAKYFWDDTSKKIVNGILNSFLENISKYKEDVYANTEHFHFLKEIEEI